jgi:hypothetical protein
VNAGDRPGDVDHPQRQVRQLGGAVPGKARELDAADHEDQRHRQDAEPGQDATAASPRRGRVGQTSTSKWALSRTPIMAPIMIIQMNRKRAISSVQM